MAGRSHSSTPAGFEPSIFRHRLFQRGEFVSPDDLVLCNAHGRYLDPAALGRRYNRARDAVGLRPLRWHDLRDTSGSLLVAAGIDTVSVKAAMGHERITTTARHLHPRPATQQAAAFTAAFETTRVMPRRKPRRFSISAENRHGLAVSC